MASAVHHSGDTGGAADPLGMVCLGDVGSFATGGRGQVKDLPLPPADKFWTRLIVRSEQELKDNGFGLLAGPFKLGEAEMLRAVVLDADRQERHLGYSESEQGEVYVWQK